MRFLHLSDLHIGKKIHEFPLFEDQRFVLLQALDLVKKENLDAIVVAGDVYDSSAPSAEAMEFYDWFLSEAYKLGKPILIISGNHDSAERLSVASSILSSAGVHIATKVEDCLNPVEIGGVNFYLLPFFRISHVNQWLGSSADSYESALEAILEKLDIDESKPNVLLTHQAYVPSSGKVSSSGSEAAVDIDSEGYIGGSEVIDIATLFKFDYCALGHIHKSQNIATNARYPGALLRYHVDEAGTERSFTIVSINEKKATIETRPISFMRDLVILEGTIEDLATREGNDTNFVYCRLLEEDYVDNPMGRLRAKYPYCIGLEYPKIKRQVGSALAYEDVDEVKKEDLFAAFFRQYGGAELDEEQMALVRKLLEECEG